jgi:hypothetical protein
MADKDGRSPSGRAFAPSASSPQAASPVPASIPSAVDFEPGYDLAIATLRAWARGFHGGVEATKWLYAVAGDLESNKRHVLAQGIEARRATTGTGVVHESPVGNADAPLTPSNPRPPHDRG